MVDAAYWDTQAVGYIFGNQKIFWFYINVYNTCSPEYIFSSKH